MADTLEIEYKDFTLEMLEAFQDKSKPLLPMAVVSINGTPLEDCDSRIKMRAGFEVVRFFTMEMQGFSSDFIKSTNGAGAS